MLEDRLRHALTCVPLIVVMCVPEAADACDLCAIYTATVTQRHKTGVWIGAAEQFTSFNTLRDGDDTIDNEAGEWLQSSITQIVVGATLHPRFTLAMALPLISREFRRLHDGEIQHGDSEGLGDMSLLGIVNAYEHVSDDSVISLDVLSGLKFPTGNARYLKEELPENADAAGAAGASTSGAEAQLSRLGEPRSAQNGVSLQSPAPARHEVGEDGEQSGIHGHDLALGSGSVDSVFGLTLFTSWRRAFFDGELQYVVRGEGSFNYRFADDLTWAAGPGAFVSLGEQHTAALQAQLTGESKGKDHQAGERLDDTAITALYLGPRVIGTFKEALHADIGVEWPVLQHVTAVQLVADWRMRAGLTWRF